MPQSMVRLSAGRESMSEATQALCFLAGANSIFTGDKLLTTANAGDGADAALFAKLGLAPMVERRTDAGRRPGLNGRAGVNHASPTSGSCAGSCLPCTKGKAGKSPARRPTCRNMCWSGAAQPQLGLRRLPWRDRRAWHPPQFHRQARPFSLADGQVHEGHGRDPRRSQPAVQLCRPGRRRIRPPRGNGAGHRARGKPNLDRPLEIGILSYRPGGGRSGGPGVDRSGERIGRVGKPIVLSGDQRADMRRIADFYRQHAAGQSAFRRNRPRPATAAGFPIRQHKGKAGADDPIPPHRQPRRNRLPDHAHRRAGSGSAPSRSIPTPTPARSTSARPMRRVHIGPSPARESYLARRHDHRRRAGDGRRGHPPRLWLPVRERRLSPRP